MYNPKNGYTEGVFCDSVTETAEQELTSMTSSTSNSWQPAFLPVHPKPTVTEDLELKEDLPYQENIFIKNIKAVF